MALQQVDNFVDDEEKEVEWTEGGYCASFGNEGERGAQRLLSFVYLLLPLND